MIFSNGSTVNLKVAYWYVEMTKYIENLKTGKKTGLELFLAIITKTFVNSIELKNKFLLLLENQF